MRHLLTTIAIAAMLVVVVPAAAGDLGPAAGDVGDLVTATNESDASASDDTVQPAVPLIPPPPLPSAIEVLTPDAVDRLVVRNDGVGACLDDAVAGGLTLPTRIWISFTIQPDGIISAAQVLDANLASSDVADCVSTAVRSGRFPAYAERDAKSIKIPLVPPIPAS
jgi:CBS domain-containing protein